MAVTTTEKRRALALRIAETATAFMQALEGLVDIGAQMGQSGLNFTGVNFADDPALQHLDEETLTAVLTSAEATNDWLTTSFNATNFQKARSR